MFLTFSSKSAIAVTAMQPPRNPFSLRYRYYDPTIGQFTSFDEFGADDITEPAHLNKYLYAGADPINMSDPTGRDFSLGEIMANIGTGIKLAGQTLNAIYRVYKVIDTIQNAVSMINFGMQMGSFIYKFTMAIAGNESLGPALSTALGESFGINVSSFNQFAPAFSQAFHYIGNRWNDLMSRIERNASFLAGEVAKSGALTKVIQSQLVKKEPVGLLINLPSPPGGIGIPWTTITLPVITLPGGFRIKIISNKNQGRLFGIGAFISGTSKEHDYNFIRIDYQKKLSSGVWVYAPHANVGPENTHVDI